MRRFQIEGSSTVYTIPSLNEITLKEMIRFNTEIFDFGLRINWHDIEQAAREITLLEMLDDPDLPDHPMGPEVLATTIWLARRRAGEDVTFDDVTEVTQSQIHLLPDPKDRQPGKARAAKKGRKTSAPAGSNRAAASSTTRRASAKKFSTGS